MRTSLVHRGFPLVNNVVGDTIELTLEDDVPYITRIECRTNDVIKNIDIIVHMDAYQPDNVWSH